MKSPATHVAAETLLHEVLERYGKSACDTPQMFETLLRKHGRACPQEINALTSALRCGVVADLRGGPSADRGALARVLAVTARVPPPQAEWAVAAWTAALAAAPNAGATPIADRPPAERAQPTSPVRAAVVLAAAAATGAMAYLAFVP